WSGSDCASAGGTRNMRDRRRHDERRRGRPTEEEDRSRDRTGPRAALGQGAAGTYRTAQKRDRPPGGVDSREAVIAFCRRDLLQEVIPGPSAHERVLPAKLPGTVNVSLSFLVHSLRVHPSWTLSGSCPLCLTPPC